MTNSTGSTDFGLVFGQLILKVSKWREELTSENLVSDISIENHSMAKICKGVFATVPVTNTPKTIRNEIYRRYFSYGSSVARANGITDVVVRVKYANSFCPLVMLDESDRLSFNSLEEGRNMYDDLHFGLVLIGMPGFEKRLSRYPSYPPGSDLHISINPWEKEKMKCGLCFLKKYGAKWVKNIIRSILPTMKQ